MLNEALKLARRGIAVFVLAQGTKVPAAGTRGVKEVSKDENEIKRRWLEHPRANVGVALGEISGLVAIDVDRNHGATDSDLARFPRTVTVRTRNGFHLYYKYPPCGVKNHSVIKLDGKDGDAAYLRSNGYYVVGPGSVVSQEPNPDYFDPDEFPNREPVPKYRQLTPWEYQWHSDAGGELSFDECEVADLPDWCLGKPVHSETVRSDSLRLGRGPQDVGPDTSGSRQSLPQSDSPRMYGPNERHAFFVRTAATMRKAGAGKEKIIRELHIANERNCQPPKPPAIAVPEIAAIADYAVKNIQIVDYEEGPVNGPMNHAPVTAIPATTDQACVDTAGDGGVVDVPAAASEPEKKKVGRPSVPKLNAYELACDFLVDNRYQIDGLDLLRYYRQEYYRCAAEGYQAVHDELMDSHINHWLVNTQRSGLAGTKVVRQIKEILRMEPRYIDSSINLPVWIDDGGTGAITPANHLLPLRSGLFDIREFSRSGQVKIIPHTPKFVCLYCLPFDLDPTATCPNYDRIADFAFGTEARKLLWEEILGIHLFQPFPLEHFFILQGEGANGKSVLLTILTALLGEDNVSSVPLDCFHPSNFSFSRTLGKLANIVSDQNDIEKFDEGMLKQFVSREPMTFNRKFKEPVTARPTAFLTIATNPMPRFLDKSDGIWRRLVLFQFDKQVPEADRDPRFLSTKFWEDSGELPGILNRALAGLRRVVMRGGLAQPEDMRQASQSYRVELDPITQFAKDCLVPSEGSYESTKAIYQAYCAMVKELGLKPNGQQSFSRRLAVYFRKFAPDVFCSKVAERKGQFVGKFWHGLKFSEQGAQYTSRFTGSETPF